MTQKTLLIVDDDVAFLKSVNRALKEEPYKILLASSGPEALDLLAEYSVNVVVTDFRMPKMDGLSLLRKVRIDSPDSIVIMLTAISDIQIAIKAINELGIFKFLLKPIQLDFFKETIARAMKAADSLVNQSGLPEAARGRDTFLCELEKKFPGITRTPPRDKDGYYLIPLNNLDHH